MPMPKKYMLNRSRTNTEEEELDMDTMDYSQLEPNSSLDVCYRTELARLREEVKDKNDIIRAYKIECDREHERYMVEQVKRSDLQAELDTLIEEQDKRGYSPLYYDLEKENEKLKEELETLRNANASYEDLLAGNEGTIDKIKKLEKENKEIRAEFYSACEENKELKDKLDRVSKMRKRMTKSAENSDEIIHMYHEKIETMIGDFAEFTFDLEERCKHMEGNTREKEEFEFSGIKY